MVWVLKNTGCVVRWSDYTKVRLDRARLGGSVLEFVERHLDP